MNKTIYVAFLLFVACIIGVGQSTLITPGNNQPSINAVSTNAGVLVPRVNLTGNLSSASPLSSPTEGTLVYNNGDQQTHGFYFWTGSSWAFLGGSSNISATTPLSIQSNTVKINAGTVVGQLITWDGTNWVNTNPKPSTNISNLQPYLVLNYCIALQGIFPSRSGAEPFLGEISIFGFNFAPSGWALCNGQILGINQNQALFALLGTTYGGDGRTTFALPNLQGRTPIHQGQGPGLSNRSIGEYGGTENITINDKY